MFLFENATNSHLIHAAKDFLPARRSLLIASCVISLLNLTPMIFMLQVHGRVISSRNFYTLAALVFIAVFLVCIWSLLEDFRVTLLRRLAIALDEKISVRVIETFNRHPNILTPQQAPLIFQDLNILRDFIGGNLVIQIFDLLFVPVILLATFLLHFWLGVTLVSLTLMSVALTLLSQKATKEDTGRAVQNLQRANEFGRTLNANAEPLRVMGMLKRLIARWRNIMLSGLGWSEQAYSAAHRFTFPLRVLRHLFQIVMQTVAAIIILNEDGGIGLLFAATLLVGRVIGPVDAIANGWRQIWNLGLSVERINIVLKKEAEQVVRVTLPRPNGPLIVNRVTVIPPGRDVPTLQDVSFVAPPGSVVGVVGPSGAGKSTLARVLTGAWPTVRGSVVLDGHDLSHWDPEQLGQYIGYVPQDIELLSGTLAENIARFETITDENGSQLVSAVKRAGILDIVSRLPEGLSTRMGPEGRTLSGGQRQRVALARAIYGDPRLVVLDEPNSNIDASGEAQLALAIEALKEAGAIVVLITHRMNMLSQCDQVLVLNSGAVHAFGERDMVLNRISAPGGVPQITDNRAKPASSPS